MRQRPAPELGPIGLEYCWRGNEGNSAGPARNNYWQAPKQLLRKTQYWDNTTIRVIIDEGWERVSIPLINERVNIMPARLRAAIEGQGAMTGY